MGRMGVVCEIWVVAINLVLLMLSAYIPLSKCLLRPPFHSSNELASCDYRSSELREFCF